MKLTDLDPRFVKWDDDSHFHYVDTISESDGVIFLCPLCFQNNAGSDIGVHSVLCWRPNIPQSTSPKPGRWDFQGTGYNDLTLVAGSSSILLTGDGGCKAHFYIQGGEIRMT
jgi:hypothetical protein